MSDDLFKTLVDIAKTHKAVIDSTCYPSMLVHEVMAPKTEHFERIDWHGASDGTLAVYRCSVDGREYHVHVKPIFKQGSGT